MPQTWKQTFVDNIIIYLGIKVLVSEINTKCDWTWGFNKNPVAWSSQTGFKLGTLSLSNPLTPSLVPCRCLAQVSSRGLTAVDEAEGYVYCKPAGSGCNPVQCSLMAKSSVCVCVCVCDCVILFVCCAGRASGRTVEGWSASDPWEWNAFPFVALQFLTGLPQHMSMMGLFLLSSFPDPTSAPSSHSYSVLPVPKAIGIPGGHQWSSFRGEACWLLGGLLCRGSEGRRQCLINWLGVLGRVQEFAAGGGGGRRSGDEGWAERDEGAEREGQIHRPPMEIHGPLSQIYSCLIYRRVRSSCSGPTHRRCLSGVI